VRALQARMPDSPALGRYDEVAQILTGKSTAQAVDGITWVQDLCDALDVPTLSDFGLTEDDFPTVVEKARKASSMKGNPVVLTDEELTYILRQAQ
jgi:alcohol dehydrogenase class IV